MTISEQQHEQPTSADATVPAGEQQQEHTPLFRRYTIPVNADVHVGAVPTGAWPIGY